MGDITMRFFTSIAPTVAGVNIFKLSININCVFKLVLVKVGLFATIKNDDAQFDAGMIAGQAKTSGLPAQLFFCIIQNYCYF